MPNQFQVANFKGSQLKDFYSKLYKVSHSI